MNLAKRFEALFTGNDRSYGLFYPKTKSHETIEEAPKPEIYEVHLSGETGLGIVPIMDTEMCWFGAIDIDAHDDDEEINLLKLESQVRMADLPLSVCRSKSGGAHLYCFCIEPIKSGLLRKALQRWAELLGYSTAEVFPKQTQLLKDNHGVRQFGNFINLCYFDAQNPDQLRYSVEGGKRIDLGHFIDTAESRKINATTLVEMIDNTHDDAPPCIRSMISNGVSSGHRNLALYNIVIYLKSAFPETWRDKAYDINANVFDDPLAHSEAKKIISSATRRDYRYKCKEEPIKSLCKSAICVGKKYGITPDEKNELEIGKAPEFTGIKKILTDPVKWVLTLDSVELYLSTPELMEFRKIREVVAEKMTILIPPMKNERWQVVLHKLMQDAVIIEAPDDASTSGIVRTKLREFLAKVTIPEGGIKIEDRKKLKLGMPVLQQQEDKDGEEGYRYICFRGMDFVSFLKKSRSEEMKGTNLWMALRKAGVGYRKLRVKKSIMQVWYVKMNDEETGDLIPPKITEEF